MPLVFNTIWNGFEWETILRADLIIPIQPFSWLKNPIFVLLFLYAHEISHSEVVLTFPRSPWVMAALMQFLLCSLLLLEK